MPWKQPFSTPTALLIILAITASGCTLSVHPVLTDAELSDDIDLSGTWTQLKPPAAGPNFKPIIVTMKGVAANKSYDLEYTNTSQAFDVRVGRIGDHRIIQFIRSDLSLEGESPILSRLPLYGFARFELKEEEFRVFTINDQAVRKLLKGEQIAYRDYNPSDMLEWCVITDRTSSLQSLVRKRSDALFRDKPLVFRRDAKPDRE